MSWIASKITEPKKIEKAQAGYMPPNGTDFKCSECVFLKGRKCALYGPDVEIKMYGTCILFQPNKPGVTVPWIGTTNKKDTGYEENMPGFSCKRCEEFLKDERKCKKVEGSISPDGCCDFWEKL